MAWQRLNGDTLETSGHFTSRPMPGPQLGPRIIGDQSIPIGTQAPCPNCHQERVREITPPNARGVQLCHWSACDCTEALRIDQSATVERARKAKQRYDDLLLGDPGASKISDLTLAAFVPQLLTAAPNSPHPYDAASAWLAAALDTGQSGRDVPITPALYFYSPTKGVGKTHLAGALYWQARERHKRVAFVEEQSFLSAVWNTPFGPRLDDMLTLPSESAWLSVIDDLGRRDPGERDGVAKTWNEIISRRYLSHAWTIFTSNYTPDELLKRRTLDEASYSRLCHMTRQQLIIFVGSDQRRKRAPHGR